jgi:hypothetical protein
MPRAFGTSRRTRSEFCVDERTNVLENSKREGALLGAPAAGNVSNQTMVNAQLGGIGAVTEQKLYKSNTDYEQRRNKCKRLIHAGTLHAPPINIYLDKVRALSPSLPMQCAC